MAKNIKELMAELEKAGKILADVHEALAGMEGTTAPKNTKAGKGTKAPKDDEDDEEGAEGREAELDAMSYNELKALVSKLGGKAVGKKPDLIAQILELEADGAGDDEEDEEEEAPKSKKSSPAKGGSAKASNKSKAKDEEPEDDEDDSDDEEEVTEEGMREQLGEFEMDELKDIAKEMGVSIKSKATKSAIINALVKDLESLDSTLEKMGYYDEEDGEGSDEDADDEDDNNDAELADKLAELDQEELANICADNGLSAKGKKQALVDRIVEAVENGDIEESDIFDGEDGDDSDDEDEDDEGATVEDIVDELELADLKKVAKALEIPVTKNSKAPALKKAILEEGEEAVYDVLVDLGFADADEDGDEADSEDEVDEDDVEVSAKVKKAEDAVEKDIRARVKSKKLKDATMKKFLAEYYEGDPDCHECNCSADERIKCYIKIQRRFVNDDAEVVEASEPYTRGGEDFCCGRKLVKGTGKKKNTLICQVCGEEYSVED